MRILLIEDEKPAARRLRQMLQQLRPQAQVVEVIDSVEGAVQWFTAFEQPDLVLMDIQLADGLSFDIFGQVVVKAPVIFTTAYDQYAIDAFKVNSVDYLLKPIEEQELQRAIEKFEGLQAQHISMMPNTTLINRLLEQIAAPKTVFKSRFLVKTGQSMMMLPLEEIAYFYSEDSLSFALAQNGKKHIIEMTLDEVERSLDPTAFFRISRKMIVSIKTIQRIHPYFNARLKLDLLPATDQDALVSRERVTGFKAWLDQ